jgi:hypothetical protein
VWYQSLLLPLLLPLLLLLLPLSDSVAQSKQSSVAQPVLVSLLC